MRPYVQHYLITGDGIEPFTTEWFDIDNHFSYENNMIVYDLHNDQWYDGYMWHNYERDNL